MSILCIDINYILNFDINEPCPVICYKMRSHVPHSERNINDHLDLIKDFNSLYFFIDKPESQVKIQNREG